jgi:flagellar biogenesis protein FliO
MAITALPLLTLLTLTDATPTPATEQGSAPRVLAKPAPASAADSVVAAAFGQHIDTAAIEQKLPSATFDWSNALAPGLALLGLAALAFGLTRRRRGTRGSIRIVEATALGPKRSLVIADVLGERLVLGVSEAGVAVLMTKAIPEPQFEPEVVTLPPAEVHPITRSYPQMGFFARLFGRTPRAQFDDVLTESIEDRELRDKLSSGMRGVVP